jgi:NTP pyrophosphatase (non-canonical NTP hydrolase)
MAQLTEEVGEVARLSPRRYGNNQRKKAIKNKDLGEELDVVLWFCVSPIKPELIYKLLSKKMDFKSVRDKDRHKNNEKLK